VVNRLAVESAGTVNGHLKWPADSHLLKVRPNPL
jgi:hypothetical protein